MAMTTTHNLHFTPHAHAYKRSAVLMLLLFFFAVQIGAQDFSSTSAYRAQREMQPQMVQSSGYQAYQSTIYEPFSNETPSSNGSNAPADITGRKNTINTGGFGTEPDPNASNNSPIGEPWILLVFAAMAAIVIRLRKKQTA